MSTRLKRGEIKVVLNYIEIGQLFKTLRFLAEKSQSEEDKNQILKRIDTMELACEWRLTSRIIAP